MNVDLQKLGVGDEIGVVEMGSVAVRKVARRTATQLILSDDSRWSVKSGRKVGSTTWSGGHLTTAEDAREQIAELQINKAKGEASRRLSDYSWRSLSLEQLQRFTAMLDEIEAAAPKVA